MRLLNRKQLAVRHAASSDETRFTLNGVFVEELPGNKTRTVATDGKILAVNESLSAPSEKFPDLKAINEAPNSASSAIIPTEAISQALKTLPRRSRIETIRENVACVLGAGTATLATTDLNLSNVVPAKTIDGPFPDWKNIVADVNRREVAVSVGLGVEVLEKIIKILKDYGARGAQFKFSADEKNPFKVEIPGCGGEGFIVAVTYKI